MKISNIKTHFSIFNQRPNLIYLDNAASTQTPDVVIEAMNEYYTKFRANIHRGLYKLSDNATRLYETAREKIANFLNASFEEIIFIPNTTYGLNLLAYQLCHSLQAGDRIVLTRLEHHANLIPWQEMAKRHNLEIKFIELTDDYQLDLASAEQIINDRAKIVSFAYVSNTLGTINPVKKLVKLSQKVGAITVVDAAQAVAHLPIDVQDLDCDWLAFSGHKMYGPTGIGVLYGKRQRLENLKPFFFGGEMIKEVTYESAQWADIPHKFEAGTPPIAEAIGLGRAIDFINKINFTYIKKTETELTTYLINQLINYPNLKIIGLGDMQNRVGVLSFTLNDIHPHDIAEILSHHNIAVRAGHHCTMPLMKHLGLVGTTRTSFGIYNTKEDIDQLIMKLNTVTDTFNT